jgi:hypothetical protein
MISNKAKKQIDTWIQKYPKGRQSSAVMEALKKPPLFSYTSSEWQFFLSKFLKQTSFI